MIKRRSGFPFSRLALFSFAMLLITTSCSREETPYQKLEGYFSGHDIYFGTNYRYVLLLTENDCPTCNNAFCSFMLSRIQSPDALFVISASGTKTDISGFDTGGTKNVVFDHSSAFLKLNILKKSGLIVLGNNQIDTIIPITATNLNDQLAYVSGKFDQNHSPDGTK
jgi:hypothetical protein